MFITQINKLGNIKGLLFNQKIENLLFFLCFHVNLQLTNIEQKQNAM